MAADGDTFTRFLLFVISGSRCLLAGLSEEFPAEFIYGLIEIGNDALEIGNGRPEFGNEYILLRLFRTDISSSNSLILSSFSFATDKHPAFHEMLIL